MGWRQRATAFTFITPSSTCTLARAHRGGSGTSFASSGPETEGICSVQIWMNKNMTASHRQRCLEHHFRFGLTCQVLRAARSTSGAAARGVSACLLLRNAISPKWSSACFFFFFFFFSTLGFYLVGRLESCVRVYVCLCVCVCLSQWLKGFHDLCPQDCEATRTGWKSFVWCWFALSASQLFRPLIRRPVTAVKICWSNNGKTFSAST